VRLAYLDCFSGISGDMVLGALVAAGADVGEISRVIGELPLGGLSLEWEEVETHGISATRVRVRADPQAVIRTYASIRGLLDEAPLPTGVKGTAQRILGRLAQADARTRSKDLEFVTFNEYGDVEVVAEAVGSAVALDLLGIERVFASPVPTGLGMARTDHGMMPIPAPVVMELLRNVPTYSRGIPVELVTPTGAAILAAVAEGYGEMPMMRADRVGYGAGHLRPDFPNVLRVVIGQEERALIGEPGGPGVAAEAGALAGSPGVLVQANVEDLPEEGIAELLERLYRAGADEAWIAPVRGRGGRVGAAVTAVGAAADLEALSAVLDAAGSAEVRVSGVRRLHPAGPPSDPGA
jgi:uncharacterized protein (TIGR00299 family) protein